MKMAVEADVAVIGAGIVGMAIAYQALTSGRSVVLIDPAPGTGATHAAAGMLAPVSELHYQEQQLLELTLESARLWPEFARPFAPNAGYQNTETLLLGVDAADRRALADLYAEQLRQGLNVQPLTVSRARSAEPLLAPGLSAAYTIPQDHQVDPRRIHAALLETFINDGGIHLSERALGLVWSDARVAGVDLGDGRTVRSQEVVVANGTYAEELQGLPPGLRLPLRKVYGDILRLRVPSKLRPLLTATVRGSVHGVPVYIVPREDGTVVIGATSREDNSSGVSAGGVYQLLRDAQSLVPAVAELELFESTSRPRPGTPDNAPLLGRVAASTLHCDNSSSDNSSSDNSSSGHSSSDPRSQLNPKSQDIPGLIVATGFFRHGVLLAPVAAQICRQLMDRIADVRWAPFRPDRFSLPTTHSKDREHS
ncbi:glycine oxidase ThiO [Pseudarthrobacter sp. J1738]|uniref:glycine oxidase ThiO n=1 Tax=Pseudarthrobacter sp. J1738 TaxID=3420446 RepID=UPI003D2B2532